MSSIALLHHHFILDEDLLSTLKMKKLGPLEIYPATDLLAPGWSFLQPITTSHISGHYFDEPNGQPHIHMDIYSCQGFDWKVALITLTKHLPLGLWQATFINRAINSHNSSGDKRSVLDIRGSGEKVEQMQQIL